MTPQTHERLEALLATVRLLDRAVGGSTLPSAHRARWGEFVAYVGRWSASALVDDARAPGWLRELGAHVARWGESLRAWGVIDDGDPGTADSGTVGFDGVSTSGCCGTSAAATACGGVSASASSSPS